jgi:hypothetical protein
MEFVARHRGGRDEGVTRGCGRRDLNDVGWKIDRGDGLWWSQALSEGGGVRLVMTGW